MEQMIARSGLQTSRWPWTEGPSTRLALQTAITPTDALKTLFASALPLAGQRPRLLSLDPNLTVSFHKNTAGCVAGPIGQL